MPTITPFLWYNNNAEEAAQFYVSVFKDAKIESTMAGPDGKVWSFNMEICGQRLILFNGGPEGQFTHAISMFVSCETQKEVDDIWNKLSVGGKLQQCGWLQDKYGVSWQIIPNDLGRLLSDPNPEKAKRASAAMMKMVKIDIQALKDAVKDL